MHPAAFECVSGFNIHEKVCGAYIQIRGVRMPERLICGSLFAVRYRDAAPHREGGLPQRRDRLLRGLGLCGAAAGCACDIFASGAIAEIIAPWIFAHRSMF
jgi:hypothetical protein